jgi:hypothetical protein
VGKAGKFIALIKTGKFQEAAELLVTEHRLNLAKLVVQLVGVTLQYKMERTWAVELNLKVAH